MREDKFERMWRELDKLIKEELERFREALKSLRSPVEVECEGEKCPLWRRGRGCIASRCIKVGLSKREEER